MSKLSVLVKLRDLGFPVPPFVGVTRDDMTALSTFLREDCVYAVRSSAAAEDSADKSFAGQFETVLDVSKENVTSAVERVLASYDNVTAYGRGSVGDTVIVQEQIEAVLSGVCFSSSVDGILNESILELTRGACRGVVDGSAVTQTWHVVDDNVWFDGDVIGDETSVRNVVLDTVAIVRRIEQCMGVPVDVEFVFDGTQVWIVQARAITSIAGKTYAEIRNNTYALVDVNICESYPGVCRQLTQDVVSILYNKIFESVVRHVFGSRVEHAIHDSLNMVEFVNGHAYYRIDSWYRVLGFVPFRDKVLTAWEAAMSLDSQYRHVFVRDDALRRISMPQTVFNMSKLWFGIEKRTDAACRDMEASLERFEGRIATYSSIDALLAEFYGLVDAIMDFWWVTLCCDLHGFVLSKRYGVDVTAHPASLHLLESLSALIDTAERYGMESDEYLASRDAYVAQYGARVPEELKLETITFKQDATLLDNVVRSRLGSTFELPDEPETDSRLATDIALREKSRLLRTRAFDVARECFLRIGETLCSEGRIGSVRDVFDLSLSDIRDTGDLHDVVTKNSTQYESNCRLPVLSHIVTFEGHLQRRAGSSTFVSPDDFTGTLHGVASSTGRAEGIVKVCHMAPMVVSRDTILVAYATDPGWSSVVSQCAGVVTERGNSLSHISIIARELGVPMLTGAYGATLCLHDGDHVVLDCEEGTVTLC